jgi:hypothetical protein
MIFMIMALVILLVIALWNFDLHKTFRIKGITQNGGDAAAVMAARWQGLSLNLIGDLNLMKAMALGSGETMTATAIDNMQARLCYTGPMVALHASQQAAKNNGIFPNADYSNYILDHARVVREEYTARVGPDGSMLFPEPYPGAWTEYADMLELAAHDGVAAGPDNMRLYRDSTGSDHILYQEPFYQAIAGRSWCWFFNNHPDLLTDYRNFFPCWWPPLPEPPISFYMNSEFYSLELVARTTTLFSLSQTDASPPLEAIAVERSFDSATIPQDAWAQTTTWYCYNQRWGAWDAMNRSAPWPMPLAADLRDQYNYAGADAAVRVEATSARLTPGPDGSTMSNTVTWTAAAKPFGYLNDNDRPNRFTLVLPAYRSARLIPVDASSAPSGGGFNLSWREHIEEHLPDYMSHGPRQRGCWYCSQLVTWERESFREAGAEWLEENSYKCTLPGGNGGGGGGGGRRRGH